MRILPLFFMTISLPILGQNNYPASGNVGFGTNSPAGLLHLKTPSNANFWSSYNYGANLVIDGPHHNAIGLLDASSSNPFAIANISGNLTISKMPALSDVSTAPTPLLTVGSDGKVGIGNSNPQSKLDIGVSNLAGINISGNSSTYVGSDINISRTSTGTGVGQAPALQFNDNASLSKSLIQGSSGGIQFFFNNNNGGWYERMRIDGSGVGVGTVPAFRFHIKGGNPNSNSMILGGTTTGNFALTSADGGAYGLFAGVSGTGKSWLQAGRYDTNTAYDIILQSAGGNVGIGSFNPDARLTVNGSIHSSEVKVDLNLPPPDYVFQKDYALPSLDQVKTYIEENKHLPEVPSAKEMEKNGVQLGEMNMLLLKKIEELTLYVIEQNKKIEEMQRENEAQRLQLSRQQDQIDNLKSKNK